MNCTACDFRPAQAGDLCAECAADPIRGAVARAAFEVVAVLCPQCQTELAFPGDVCGLCKPGELPQLS